MSTCKKCGTQVKWIKKDRWYCENEDGSDHWDLCSKIRWQQTKETGTRFVEKNESGYANSIHGTKLDHSCSGWIKGKKYKPPLIETDLPPWD